MSVGASSALRTGSGRTVDPENTVTPRQLEILALVASGYSYTEIAGLKFYSQWTVQNHARSAVSRSGARNTVHLVAVLVERKLIRRNSEGVYEPVQDLRIVEE